MFGPMPFSPSRAVNTIDKLSISTYFRSDIRTGGPFSGVVSDIRFVSERIRHPCLRALGQNIVNHEGIHAKRRGVAECRTIALMTCAKYAVNTERNPYICCGP